MEVQGFMGIRNARKDVELKCMLKEKYPCAYGLREEMQ
jgi:hypothetical protein